MAGAQLCLFILSPLFLAASTEAKTWRYWPNIGCYDFNFERTVFFELTNDANELSTTKGLELPVIVNSSIVPSLDNELQIQHTLTGSIRNSTTNTPEECITFCNSTGYAYAGLQEGIRCVCMNEHPVAKTTSDRCDMTCSGDGSFSCGGQWTMDVHQNPHYHSSNLTYIGCFKNSFNELDRLLIEGEFNNFRNNTPELCVEVCTNGGYDYAGTQYGSQCICTNTGPQGNSEAEKCHYRCAGDRNIRMCGGLGYINIFHTDAHKTTIDDWGCGNSAQDQFYQKWYADMDHCGITDNITAPGCPESQCPTEWTKINQEEDGVAWGAMDDGFGRWQVASKICGRKLKLQHRSGAVWCAKGQQHHTNFGCANLAEINDEYPDDTDDALSTYLTTGKGSEYAVVPYEGDPKVASHPSYPGWYVLSGYNSTSPFLVFDLPQSSPEAPYFCFEEGIEYQLWYGEDMVDAYTDNNGGTAYTDIYIMS